jgi:hypothetical protein
MEFVKVSINPLSRLNLSQFIPATSLRSDHGVFSAILDKTQELATTEDSFSVPLKEINNRYKTTAD